MLRDPFFRDIEARLKDRLDPELFERCAADLLRSIYPSLVPVRGGQDRGMDGAIADGEGPAYPLVATTSDDVIENVRTNLKSYIESGGRRRKAVVATSRLLTAERRRNVEDEARKIGFEIVQVHDQAAMAELLYGSPAWCTELLGISGDPPALSSMPRSRRSVVSVPLVGRDDDVAWICGAEDDLLLTGQPGAGKTSVLWRAAKLANGRFVVDGAKGRILAALRRDNPSFLIVDDAHLNPGLLTDLRNLRDETRLAFRLVASSWPGATDELRMALQARTGAVRALQLLSRNDIVEVIRGTGIAGPPGLIRELVDQSEGRPGLAHTLALLVLRGEGEQVALGDALAHDVLTPLRKLIGSDPTGALAGFAIGGEYGMRMAVVARWLGSHETELRVLLSQLAAGGVIVERGERVVVRPPALRDALVRDVFFAGTARDVSFAELLEHVRPTAAAITIARAHARGGRVPGDLLRELALRCRSDSVWKHLVTLGPDEASWVLEQYTGSCGNLCPEILFGAPDIAIPRLLEEAARENHPVQGAATGSLQILSRWATAGYPGTTHAAGRRSLLLNAVLDWLGGGGDRHTAYRAVKAAFSPAFEATESDPGSGKKLTWIFGCISEEDARAVAAMWPRLEHALDRWPPPSWRPICEIVEDWLYPGRGGRTAPEPTRRFMCATAERMLAAVSRIASARPEVAHWAAQTAEQFEMALEINIEPEFEVLFPARQVDDLEGQAARWEAAANAMAERWSHFEPTRVAARVRDLEDAAKSMGITWPRYSEVVALAIASRAGEPMAWLEAFRRTQLAADLIAPFLRKGVASESPSWTDAARKCLESTEYRGVAVQVLLTAPATPPELFERMLQAAVQVPGAVEHAIRWNPVCVDRVRALLLHESDAVAAAAARGEWYAEPSGSVRADLAAAWDAAALRTPGDQYFLVDAFRHDPGLAERWLTRRLGLDERPASSEDYVIDAAIDVLDSGQRERIIQVGNVRALPADQLVRLLGEDLGLCRLLFGQRELHRQLRHALALGRQKEFDGKWRARATIAFDCGMSVEDVFEAIDASGWGWSGDEADMWEEMIARFRGLAASPDPRFQELAALGIEVMRDRRDRARVRNHEEDVRGFYDP